MSTSRATMRPRRTPIKEWLLTINVHATGTGTRYMRIPDFVSNREAALMYDRMHWGGPPLPRAVDEPIILGSSSDESSSEEEEEETADDRTFIDDSNVTKADKEALQTLQRGLKRRRSEPPVQDGGPDCKPADPDKDL